MLKRRLLLIKCPKCNNVSLKDNFTKQGVVIDVCPSCKGIWLDEGEIYMFSKNPQLLSKNLNESLIDSHDTGFNCPRCEGKLEEGGFLEENLLIDRCKSCKGLWFDNGELKKALDIDSKQFQLNLDESYLLNPNDIREEWNKSDKNEKLERLKFGIASLPNLALRSTMCFVMLYGFLFFILLIIGDAMQLHVGITCAIGLIFVFIQYLINPFILDISLSWFYSLYWEKLENLPSHLAKFIEETCAAKKMKIPKIGIINDMNPNAFTYGRTPNDARIVITKGILKLLDEDEVNAVVAHEIGHAYNWDILVMTLAAVVPMILYSIYRMLIRASRRTKGNSKDKGKGNLLVIAIVSYLIYIISEYIVLWLSRAREYCADRFAGHATQKPNALASALVKIAYGIVSLPEKKDNIDRKGLTEEEIRKEKLEHVNRFDRIKTLGIFNSRDAQSIALTSYSEKTMEKGAENKEEIASAMQWDLWNPWASYYEIHSTHPLPAKRIDALTEQAASMNQEPFIIFNRKKPESYWDDFLIDVFFYFLPLFPFLALILFFTGGMYIGFEDKTFWKVLGGFFATWGLAYGWQTKFSYPNNFFPKMKISSLLGKIKVSKVRPVPCTIKGKIIGRGVPGYMFSEDMILQDQTGIIFLDYRQPLSIFEFLFALTRTNKYIGKEVEISGWYRRSPLPYIELKSMKFEKNKSNCYIFHFKLLFALLLFFISIACFMKSAFI